MADKPTNVEKVEIPVQSNIYTVLLFAALLLAITATAVVIERSVKLYGVWWGESMELKQFKEDQDRYAKEAAKAGWYVPQEAAAQ